MTNQSTFLLKISFSILFSFLFFTVSIGQKENIPPVSYEALEWRSIGPFRGGRSAAVTGVPGQPKLFYMGTTGGGVWKTIDGGAHWQNISDGYFGGSIGAIAVSKEDPNVIYAGGGEVTVRGNVSSGSGMWKSDDAGKTWQSIGLKNSRHIPRIRIHPKNSDIVFAAVLGDLFKSSKERGIYRSKDGGKTWENVLFVNEDAGAVDLVIDPNNARIMYASTWRVRRTPYSLDSGGNGSALWKSTDGGSTWKNISAAKGLPKGVWGISGVTVSSVNSERLWTIIENKDGGVFRSDDGGETWKLVNNERKLRQRAWYYSRIYADTQDEDRVYVANVRFHRSKDGGKTFEKISTPHGDHHDFWIAPEDNTRMIIADDGGGQISYDAGANWSTYLNQPTAQFYRVVTDNHFPYRIYGAQQDNSAVRIKHRSNGWAITAHDWEVTAGGESAHIAIDPQDEDIVYGGSYDGFLTKYNHRTEQLQAINVWPDNPMGHGAEDMKYRFQWNFPIFFSPHYPDKLYTASNHLHVSTDQGRSWQTISPDLTRNDSSRLVSSGGPITQDNTGVEYYCTIFAAVESAYEKDLLWVGSDDGLVHISRDAGKNWTNITPKAMPEWLMINSIDVNPFEKGSAYIAGTRYKLGDNTPYLYKVTNYGKTWKLITNGIPKESFTRVVRTDPNRQGLLYAGTEHGMFISFDDGQNWQSFQQNLPIVPITDIAYKNSNLIVATQGRSFWLIDDLTPLYQLNQSIAHEKFHLFKPLDAYRMNGSYNAKVKNQGINHKAGVTVLFNLSELPEDSTEVRLTFMETDGNVIKSYSNLAKEKNEQLTIKKGGNSFTWDMHYADAKKFKGMIFWWGSTRGAKAVPGDYKVQLKVGQDSMVQQFTIVADPRAGSSPADYQAQFDFINEINTIVTAAHEAIIDIRDVKNQLNNYSNRLSKKKGVEAVTDQIKSLKKSLSDIEKTLYQVKNRSGQDPLNFPIRLTNKLAHLNALVSMGNYRPNKQDIAVKDELMGLIQEQLDLFEKIKKQDIKSLNQLIKEKAFDAIMLDD